MAGNDICTMFAVGRLTRDPECRDTNGKVTYRVAKFSLAINQYVKGDDDHVTFIDCEAWQGLARTVEQFCGKGKQVAISGAFRIDQWTDKDGNARSTPMVKVDKLQLISSPDGGGKSQRRTTAPMQEAPAQVSADDLPF